MHNREPSSAPLTFVTYASSDPSGSGAVDVRAHAKCGFSPQVTVTHPLFRGVCLPDAKIFDPVKCHA